MLFPLCSPIMNERHLLLKPFRYFSLVVKMFMPHNMAEYTADLQITKSDFLVFYERWSTHIVFGHGNALVSPSYSYGFFFHYNHGEVQPI